jgi:hypothetical protein
MIFSYLFSAEQHDFVKPEADLSDIEKAKKIAKWLRNHIKGRTWKIL